MSPLLSSRASIQPPSPHGAQVAACASRSFTIRMPKSQAVTVWELRIVNLAPILRMYPKLRVDMMEHVRNSTLVLLARGDARTSNTSTTVGRWLPELPAGCGTLLAWQASSLHCQSI